MDVEVNTGNDCGLGAWGFIWALGSFDGRKCWELTPTLRSALLTS